MVQVHESTVPTQREPDEWLPDEPGVEACAAILQSLRRDDLNPSQRELLAADYAGKRDGLDDEGRRVFDGQLAQSFLRGEVKNPAIGARAVEYKREPVDVAVVTVKYVELRAACAAFDIDMDAFKQIGLRRYYRTSCPSQHSRRRTPSGDSSQADLSIVLTMIGKALDVNATKVVDELLGRFDPKVLFLLGMAAGNRDKVEIGDVVVPSYVHYYDPDKRTPDGQLTRAGNKEVPQEVTSNIGYLDVASPAFYTRLDQFWRSKLGSDKPPGFSLRRRFRPAVHHDEIVIASGASLITDGILLPELRARFNERLIAADQESFGFATACYGKWWGIFRGVSDYGDAAKNSDWQFLSTAVAANLLRHFLETQYVPPDSREL